MIKRLLLLVSFIAFAYTLQAQNPIEFFLNFNINVVKSYNDDHGTFPVLWYDDKQKPKVLIGGAGIGVTAFKPLSEKLTLKGQANILRHVYWNEPLEFKDSYNIKLGALSNTSTDYTFNVSALIQYPVASRIFIGTGAGLSAILISQLYIRDKHDKYINIENRYLGENQFYKPLMPMIPVEIMYRNDKMFMALRYEHALLNRYKKSIDSHKFNFGIIYTEVGFRI